MTRRLVVAGVVAVLVAGVALTAVLGGGFAPSRVALGAGAAWLASPGQGLLSLVDGPSELVLGSVRTTGGAEPADVVQAGASALVVDPATGTVTRVDGATYAVGAPVRFGTPGGSLQALSAPAGVYVVDRTGQRARYADPATLQVRREMALADAPGPDQSVVDADGTLWTVGAGGVAGFTANGGTVRSAVGDAASRLVTVGGRPVLVDVTGKRAALLEAGGGVGPWSCLDLGGPADGVQAVGGDGAAVFATVPATGQLVRAELGSGGGCAAPVPVGNPGEQLGTPVATRGFVLVPNATTGHTAVVDVAAGRVVADLTVLPAPSGRLELLDRDGLVFYNDLAGDRVGIIRFDGTQFVVGAAARKFGSGPDAAAGPAVLAAGTGGLDTGANPPAGLPGARPDPTKPVPVPQAPNVTPTPGTPVQPTPTVVVTDTPRPTPTPTPTPSETPKRKVTTPDLSDTVDGRYEDYTFYIRSKVNNACEASGNPSGCLRIGTRVNRGRDRSDLESCVILAAPAAGRQVDPGSSFTFTINRPCGEPFDDTGTDSGSSPPSS